MTMLYLPGNTEGGTRFLPPATVHCNKEYIITWFYLF